MMNIGIECDDIMASVGLPLRLMWSKETITIVSVIENTFVDVGVIVGWFIFILHFWAPNFCWNIDVEDR